MNAHNESVFTISGLTLCFQTEQPLVMIDRFQPFLGGGEPDYRIRVSRVPELPPFPEAHLHEDISFDVAEDGQGGYLRRFRDAAKGNRPYAIARYDWANKCIFVEHLPHGAEFVREIGSCFFHIAWEALLMREGRMLLHAACVDTPYGGILFSGPSGIGKSTQADLWCRYGGGRLINGDRTVLREENGRWLGYGSPYAGSSKCYRNESCPVRAIVLLKQAPRCSLRRLPAAEAFRGIFSGLTVNSWDREFVSFACDFAQGLAERLPVYELACTPDENAVTLLREEMML